MAGRFDREIANTLKNKMSSIREIVERKDDIQKLTTDNETRIAYDSVQKAIPRIRVFVRERLRKKGFRLEDLIGSTNAALLGRLENWIPPDAYAEGKKEIVSDLRSILNVGWLRWISAYDSMKTTVREPQQRYFKEVDALNRLVLKAIEYADLRSMWNDRGDLKQE